MGVQITMLGWEAFEVEAEIFANLVASFEEWVLAPAALAKERRKWLSHQSLFPPRFILVQARVDPCRHFSRFVINQNISATGVQAK
jgi:hypothetical protein